MKDKSIKAKKLAIKALIALLGLKGALYPYITRNGKLKF